MLFISAIFILANHYCIRSEIFLNGTGSNKQSMYEFTISYTNTNLNFLSFAIDVHQCIFSAFLQHQCVIYIMHISSVLFDALHTRHFRSMCNMIMLTCVYKYQHGGYLYHQYMQNNYIEQAPLLSHMLNKSCCSHKYM